VDRAFGCCGHRVQPDQRTGGHENLPSVPCCDLFEVRVDQQSAHRQYDEPLACLECRLRNLREQVRWCAFDHDIGVVGEPVESNNAHRTGQGGAERRGLGRITHGDRGEPCSGNASIERTSEHLADGTEPGDRYTLLRSVCHPVLPFLAG
jgi:hypothetical protein